MLVVRLIIRPYVVLSGSRFTENIVDGIPVAILLQHGHATRSGYFIEGVDYMNPALKPIFEALANEAWREITRG